jgi:hypothetical protein
MLEPLRNPANWDSFRKVAVLILILWTVALAVLCIIYFFVLGGRSPAPTNIFRALILAAPCLQSGGRRRKTGANDFRSPDHGAAAEPNGFRRVVRARDAQRSRHRALAGSWPL